MKKTILTLTLALMMIMLGLSIITCASKVPLNPSKSRYAGEFPSIYVDLSSQADIWVEGATMYYNGDIGAVEYELFEYVLDTYASEPIEKMIINSGGGDTVVGRKLGNYIFDNQIDVEVDKICFSSCANYVFTAGKHKIIRADSFIGWHGSEHQLIYEAEFDNISPYESFLKTMENATASFSEKIKKRLPENFLEEQVKLRLSTLPEEAAFFEKIGVNIHITLVGLLEYEGERDVFPAYGNAGLSGWTYSIEDMKLFGVDNVTYLGDTSYPSEKASKTGSIFKAEIGDYDTSRVFDYTPEGMGIPSETGK